jgi:O-antigen/teichoic acid export membrane protein
MTVHWQPTGDFGRIQHPANDEDSRWPAREHRWTPERWYAGRRRTLNWDPKGSLPIAATAPASPASRLAQSSIAVLVDAMTTQAVRRGSWVSALRPAWGKWQTVALALADQAVVSGVSFLTTVLISHWTSASQLGLYAIGISVLISMFAIQDSLISLPYTIQQHQPLRMPNDHAGSSLAHCGMLSALCVFILAASALGLFARGSGPELTAMALVLAAVAPFALLREFERRLAFARLRMGLALILDMPVATIQLLALCWLGWTDRMSAANAYAAIGGACALTSIVWLYFARTNFVIRADQVRATMAQSWGLGKWLFALQITVSVQACVPYWLLALGVGTTATGVYAACISIVLFANPLMIGIGNTLAPKAALALKEGGYARLRREASRDSLLLGGAMTLFCLIVLFAGEDVMRLLYHGKEYAGHGHTVMVLALAQLASALGMPATFSMQSMERPQAIVLASSVGAVFTVVLVWSLMIEWGLLGAAYGFLAGNIAGTMGRWIAFLALVPRCGAQTDPKTDSTIGQVGLKPNRLLWTGGV